MKRNPFVVQSNITSYSYPASKIIICSVIISASLLRSYFLPSLAEWIDNLITFLCFFLTISSILCLYIGIIELCQAYENRIQKKKRFSEAKLVPIEDVIKLASKNDIINLVVCTPNGSVQVGTSSESQSPNYDFRNKRYYINDLEYNTIQRFKEALIHLFPSRNVPVLSIDDLPPDCFSLDCIREGDNPPS